MNTFMIDEFILAVCNPNNSRGELALEKATYIDENLYEIADALGLDIEKTRDKLVENMKKIGMELEDEYAPLWLKEKWHRVIL